MHLHLLVSHVMKIKLDKKIKLHSDERCKHKIEQSVAIIFLLMISNLTDH